jgi:hypothetical protein
MTKKVSKLKLKRNMKNKKTHVGRGKGNNENNDNNENNGPPPIPGPPQRPVPAPRPPSVKKVVSERPVPPPRPESTFAKPRNNNPPPTGVAARRAQLEAEAAAAAQPKASNKKNFGIRNGLVGDAKSRELAQILQAANNQEKLRRFKKEAQPQVFTPRSSNIAPPVSAQNLARAVAERAGELDYFGSQRIRTGHLNSRRKQTNA